MECLNNKECIPGILRIQPCFLLEKSHNFVKLLIAFKGLYWINLLVAPENICKSQAPYIIIQSVLSVYYNIQRHGKLQYTEVFIATHSERSQKPVN